MPNLTLQFPRVEYSSLQVGDIAYFANTLNTSGDFTTFQTEDDAATQIELGPVTAINHTTSLGDGTLTTTITIVVGEDAPTPTSENYVFFAKDNRVNMTSLLGYYGSATFYNFTGSKAEMFATSCEVGESSK